MHFDRALLAAYGNHWLAFHGDRARRQMRQCLGLTAVCLAVAGWLAYNFVLSTPLADRALGLTIIAVPFMLIVGFLIAGICGYMAGLIGASNSPISGVGILSIVLFASLLMTASPATEVTRPALVAMMVTKPKTPSQRAGAKRRHEG